jgi:hypothetical protein
MIEESIHALGQKAEAYMEESEKGSLALSEVDRQLQK